MRTGALVLGVWATVALTAAPAAARPAHASRCCRVPAGTMVQVELADGVSTKTQKAGDSVALRLSQPLIVNGQVVLRAGARGLGQVVESAKPGMGGKPAKLVLAGRYLTGPGGAQVPLQALQLSGAGRNNAMAAQAAGLGGIAFMPLGFVGLAVRGGDVTFPRGTLATARVAGDMTLPSRGKATRAQLAALSRYSKADEQTGLIDIPPPPPGQGQVVFFRAKSLLGTGQWFKVREGGQSLGKLSNGAYFVQVEAPGAHAFTATEEPELKDRLRLEIDAGETYYVEGGLAKGVVVGAAFLSPSDRASFDAAAKDLKLAAAAGEEPASARSDQRPTATASENENAAVSTVPADSSAAATAAAAGATPPR
jgi:hypothetical protein